MKCPVHSDKDVVGYCTDCGAFGCDICLVPTGTGESLCLKCGKAKNAAVHEGKKGLVSRLLGEKKQAKSDQGRSTFARSSVVRKGAAGRKLEVRYKKDKIIKGTTYKLDMNTLGFYLVPIDPEEEEQRVFVNFSDLKAIYFVRDFEGKSDRSDAPPEYVAEGDEVKVAFQDGEIVEGRTLRRFDPTCQRFFIIPRRVGGNIISILVERSALKGIEMDGFREGMFSEEEEVLIEGESETIKKGRAPLSQNESMGDLYFSMKNYDSALAEYEKVQEEYPDDKRLKLKISICSFNRGVNFIKSRKYQEAKTEFEKIGEDDPIYRKAKKKIRKIEKILKEVESMGG